MEADLELARSAVMDVIRSQPQDRLGGLLRALMASAAAGLTVIEGEAAASEAAYRLADAVVSLAPAEAVEE